MHVENILGEYPYRIEPRPDKTAVLFYPKRLDAQDPDSPVLTLFFDFTDDQRRNRLRELLQELGTMG